MIDVLSFFLVFSASLALGINLLEMLTATTLVQSDPLHHFSKRKKLNKVVMHLMLKNSLYIMMLLIVFLTVYLDDPGNLNMYYGTFISIMVVALLGYALLDPIYIDRVRPRRTRVKRSFVFKVSKKKEKRIVFTIKTLGLINSFILPLVVILLIFRSF